MKIKQVTKYEQQIRKETDYAYVRILSTGLNLVCNLISKTLFTRSILSNVPKLDTNMPTMIISNHQSHLDYLLHKRALHHIYPNIQTIAGNNLNIGLLGWFFKKTNAMFVRRKKEELNKQYLSIFQAQLGSLLDKGVSLGLFPEGTRSRNGRIKDLKLGVIKYFLSYLVKTNQKGMIVPSGICYDFIYEFETLTKSKLVPKRKSLKGSSYLNYGLPLLIAPEQARDILLNLEVFGTVLLTKILECVPVSIGSILFFIGEQGGLITRSKVLEFYTKLYQAGLVSKLKIEDFDRIFQQFVDGGVLLRVAIAPSELYSFNFKSDHYPQLRYQGNLLRQKLESVYAK